MTDVSFQLCFKLNTSECPIINVTQFYIKLNIQKFSFNQNFNVCHVFMLFSLISTCNCSCVVVHTVIAIAPSERFHADHAKKQNQILFASQSRGSFNNRGIQRLSGNLFSQQRRGRLRLSNRTTVVARANTAIGKVVVTLILRNKSCFHLLELTRYRGAVLEQEEVYKTWFFKRPGAERAGSSKN